MSDDIKSKNPELLVELPEQEQESVVGGFGFEDFFGSFFFQQTDIASSAEKQTNIFRNDGTSGSTLARTGYRSSQTTLAFNSFPFSRKSRYRTRMLMNAIFKFLRSWSD